MSWLDDLSPSCRVLEVGAGQGAMGARLAQRFRYTGIEMDDDSAAVARGRIELRGGRFLHGDADQLDAGDGYDVVCAFEVLEHLPDDAAALSSWRQRLAPGGRLVLSVPAWQDRFGPWDVKVGHFRRYDPPDLAALLVRCGFEDARLQLVGFPLGYLTEPLRDLIAARGGQGHGAAEPHDLVQRTAGSGRQLQAKGLLGRLTRPATAPFRLLQRRLPGIPWGTGIVAVASRPA